MLVVDAHAADMMRHLENGIVGGLCVVLQARIARAEEAGACVCGARTP